jgi:hypothetical protein
MTAVVFTQDMPKYVKVQDFEELLDNHILDKSFEVTIGKPPPAKKPYYFPDSVAASLRGDRDLLAVIDSHLYEDYTVRVEWVKKHEHNQGVMRRFKKIGVRERRFSV